MKSIQLTRDHKVKLLEMCNKLCKDSLSKTECYCEEDQGSGYTYSDEHGECDVCSNNSFEFFDNSIHFTNDSDDRITIHWFEFCLLHLSEKIYKTFFKLGEKDNWYGCHLSWAINSIYTQNTNKVHLVDYLYEEFKK